MLNTNVQMAGSKQIVKATTMRSRTFCILLGIEPAGEKYFRILLFVHNQRASSAVAITYFKTGLMGQVDKNFICFCTEPKL